MPRKTNTPKSQSGKTSEELSPATEVETSTLPFARWPLSAVWRSDTGWSIPATLAPLSDECAYSLSLILQDDVPAKYSLSQRACSGILTRAEKRGKKLPEKLKTELEQVSGQQAE